MKTNDAAKLCFSLRRRHASGMTLRADFEPVKEMRAVVSADGLAKRALVEGGRIVFSGGKSGSHSLDVSVSTEERVLALCGRAVDTARVEAFRDEAYENQDFYGVALAELSLNRKKQMRAVMKLMDGAMRRSFQESLDAGLDVDGAHKRVAEIIQDDAIASGAQS